MKIIEPKVELWQQGGDAKVHVARCARVCYGREIGNDQATIKRLIDSEHWSMFLMLKIIVVFILLMS